jgi:hypothetical protein
MRKFIVERELPQIGSAEGDELKAVAPKSSGSSRTYLATRPSACSTPRTSVPCAAIWSARVSPRTMSRKSAQ